jgi:hypothetical protein
MLRTEEEARKCWCPFARVGSETTGAGGLNRDYQTGSVGKADCIASECMAWRWEPDSPKPIEQHRGFCGVAGLSTDLPPSQVRA